MTEVEFIPKQFVVVSETEPAAFEGLIWYNPSTGIWKQFKDGEWQIIIPLVVSDSEPQEKIDGMLWFDKANDVLKIYDEPQGEFRKLGINWEDIINKPTSYPPAPHIHGDADLSGISWDKILNKPTSFPVDLHRVKLPSPLTSDFITPLLREAATGLVSSVKDGANASQLTVNPNNMDTSPVYDDDDNTAAHIMKASNGDTIQLQWDLGSNIMRKIYVKHGLSVGSYGFYTYIDISEDGDSWETISSKDSYYGLRTTTYQGIHKFRYVRWRIHGIDNVTMCDWYLYTLNTYPADDPNKVVDDDEASVFQFDPSVSVPYITLDLSAEKIISAIRVNFPDASYLPSQINLYGSLDGENFDLIDTFENFTTGWNELTFNARYLRYFKLEFDTPNIKTAEIDYYSRITDRVAAEHGHGSGVKDYLNLEKRSSKFSLADSLKLKSEEIKKKRAKAEKLEDRIKTLEEEIEEIKKYLITLL